MKKNTEKFVVVFTDGYEFKNHYFDSYEDASDFMEKEYLEQKEFYEANDCSISEDSYIDISEARLIVTGIEMFLWEILGF